MIILEADNFKGLAPLRLELPAGKVVMLAARNGSGKSRIATALAATAADKPMPCGQPKTMATEYITWGKDKAVVTVTLPTGSRRMTWVPAQGSKDATVRNEGDAQSIGANAAGLQQFTKLKIEQRAAILNDVLEAQPTAADLAIALCDKLGEKRAMELVEGIWKDIEALGWQGRDEAKQEDAKYNKRKWQELTRLPRWDTKIGAGWLPEGWEHDLETASVESLAAIAKVAETNLSQAAQAKAFDEGRAKVLTERTAKLTTFSQQNEALKKEVETLGAEVNVLRAALASIPDVSEIKTVPCPHCAGELVVHGGKVTKPESLTANEKKEREYARRGAQIKLTEAQSKLAEKEREYREAYAALKGAQDAAEDLRKMHAERAEAGAAVNTDEAGAALAHAQARLSAKQRKTEADRLHAIIIESLAIADILAVDGLRKTKLAESLREFSEGYLEHICNTAGWSCVEITPDLEVAYGGIAFNAASAGEQFRINFTLQLALAMKQKSPLVIIDYTDSADSAGLGGAINALTSCFHEQDDHEWSALICVKANKPDAVPNLADTGHGATYWIEKGVLKARPQPVGAK